MELLLPQVSYHEIHPHNFASYLSNDILPTTNYKAIVKSLHTEMISQSISSNRLLKTASPKVGAAEEANFPRPYRTSLSQLHPFVAPSIPIVRG